MIRWLAVVLAVVAAGTGAAQVPGQSPVQAANAVARCIAKAQQAAAIGVLDLPLMSAEQATAATTLLDQAGGCAPADRQLELTTLFLVGGMAEELVVTKYGNVSPTVIKLIQPTVAPRSAEEDLALCFSEKWPAETRNILTTSVGSPGEALAVGRILPQIGTCVPAGMTMRLNSNVVRALAAYAVYRVSSQIEQGLIKLNKP